MGTDITMYYHNLLMIYYVYDLAMMLLQQWDDGYSGLSDILSSTRNRKFRDAVLEDGDGILTAILSGKGWQTWQTIELWGTHILFIQTHITGPSLSQPIFPLLIILS